MLNYKWMKVASIKFNSDVLCICWNCDDNRLLIALKSGYIQVWAYNSNLHATHSTSCQNQHQTGIHAHHHPKMAEQPVKFSIEEEDEDMLDDNRNTTIDSSGIYFSIHLVRV